MFVVGLTGGIGSGKSTVADQFKQLGVSVIDTDLIAREIVDSDPKVLEEIITEFGTQVLSDNDSLNRSKLKEMIFSAQEKKNTLEHILHPRIRSLTLKKIHAATGKYCIVVVPLLVETKFYNFVDRVLVIDLAEDLQLDRTVKRDEIDKALAKKIISAQTNRAARLAKADDIIDNNLDLESLKKEVIKLNNTYLKIADKTKYQE